jgi:hypothetical protein
LHGSHQKLEQSPGGYQGGSLGFITAVLKEIKIYIKNPIPKKKKKSKLAPLKPPVLSSKPWVL